MWANGHTVPIIIAEGWGVGGVCNQLRRQQKSVGFYIIIPSPVLAPRSHGGHQINDRVFFFHG
jgi:hypothetical protein